MNKFIVGAEYYAEGFDVPITVLKRNDNFLWVYTKVIEVNYTIKKSNPKKLKIRLNVFGDEIVKIGDAVFVA